MVNKSIGSETHKTAVVTGGSRGLGRNTSLNLATRGVDIIFTYHSNKAEADSLISEVEGIGQKAAAFRLDTAELCGFDAFVAEVRNTLQSWARERFEYLVNNAGNYREINFENVTEADFDAVVNVHFKGWRSHCEYFVRAYSFHCPRQLSVCPGQGCDRGADALPR